MLHILIWGVGEIEREFNAYLNDNVKIAGYVDSYSAENHNGITVYTPQEVFSCVDREKYDYIVVASVYTNEIYAVLNQYDIDQDKVIFLRPFQVMGAIDDKLRGLNKLKAIAPDYVDIARRENGYLMGIDARDNPYTDRYPLYQWDYFRYRTFELIADQIINLPGAVAEAGIFKGFFSKLINSKFPNSRLYMFDSFEGFIEEEAVTEKMSRHCNQDFIEMFKDTSIETVLCRMPHKEQCIIKKGFFPKSAEDIDEIFKFVSIDFDFEQSIYEALVWFYPKVVNGGYIFLHDYNEPTLLGVKQAVNRYEEENGVLIKIPIADKCGTLIIYKG